MALSDRPRGRGHTRTTRRRRSHASSFAVARAFLLSLFARARAAEEGGVVDDASSFEGPADPEAEALSKAWGPEETFVVLPRLESLRGDGDVPWIEQISWSPRAQVYHNFLTPEECDHLVEMARPRMSVASVVDKKTGASKPSDVRTSTGHFIRRAEDAVATHRGAHRRVRDGPGRSRRGSNPALRAEVPVRTSTFHGRTKRQARRPARRDCVDVPERRRARRRDGVSRERVEKNTRRWRP